MEETNIKENTKENNIPTKEEFETHHSNEYLEDISKKLMHSTTGDELYLSFLIRDNFVEKIKKLLEEKGYYVTLGEEDGNRSQWIFINL